MAFGDIGGVVTELVITCQTPSTGPVSIAKGDAVKLTGNYTISNGTADEDAVLGQALASVMTTGTAIPVKVRGICVFSYAGTTAPTVNGIAGIVGSVTAGKVKVPASGNGKGVNVKVDTVAKLVHVLL